MKLLIICSLLFMCNCSAEVLSAEKVPTKDGNTPGVYVNDSKPSANACPPPLVFNMVIGNKEERKVIIIPCDPSTGSLSPISDPPDWNNGNYNGPGPDDLPIKNPKPDPIGPTAY